MAAVTRAISALTVPEKGTEPVYDDVVDGGSPNDNAVLDGGTPDKEER